jgi:cytochrome c oxidase subunit 1
LVGGVFQVVFLFNFFYSMFYGKKSVQNRRDQILEWTAPIEHIHGNWPGEIQKYTDGHMITVNLVLREDFVPQNVPMQPGEEILHH